MLEIKLFDPHTDYPHMAQIENTVFTDEFFTAQGLQDDDKRLPKHVKQQRFVAWLEGQAVGFAQYSQNAGQYHPQRFSVWVEVLPEFTQRGIGGLLYQRLLEDLAQHQPIAFSSNTREDKYGLEFLQRRGFVEKMRTWENRIALASHDHTPHQHLRGQLEAQGIQIINLEQFLERFTPEDYYRLNQTLSRDVPRLYPMTERSFEEWASWNLYGSKVLPHGTFFAVSGSEPIGMSQLFKSDGKYITIGLTAVLRQQRGKQLALALKTTCLEWAKTQGYFEVRTWNDSNNAPILALNSKLGFVRCPAWIECVKELEQA
jgi:mycothiol synthase